MSSMVREPKPNPKSLKLKTKLVYQQEDQRFCCTLPNFDGIYQPSSSSSTSASREGESSEETEDFGMSSETTVLDKNPLHREMLKGNHMLGMPLQLSWEVISEITNWFNNMICVDPNDGFEMYGGYMPDYGCRVFVKRYIGGDFSSILESEIRAAMCMSHRNIIGLLGYHQNEKAMALVFPRERGTSMDKLLEGYRTKKWQLPFQTKLKIVIGIAQGIRYMHEECPRGPIVHGDIRPCNILLRLDSQPQITGFGRARWLQLEQPSSISNHSCGHKHPTDPELLALIKSDIFAFGILLLRLFCKRSAPRDKKGLLQWARPLLVQRAYHKLYYEKDSEDTYGMFRVTSTVSQCIKTQPKSRPCMSEVVALLKGEISCAQSSPLSDGSPYCPIVAGTDGWFSTPALST